MEDNVESNGYPGLSTLYCVHQAIGFGFCQPKKITVKRCENTVAFTGHLQSSGPGASNGQRLDVDMGKNMEFIFWKAGMLKDDWLRLPALAYHMDRRGIPTVFLQYSCILKPELIRMIR